MLSFFLPALLSSTLHWLLVYASVTNRTIDDTYGDSATGLQVQYTSNWHTGPGCTVCAVQPNKTLAFGGTWHDTTSNNPNSTSPHSATLKFNGMPLSFHKEYLQLKRFFPAGTAIWAFFILANTGGTNITIYTNASFELDGVMDTYTYIPNPPQGPYTYNVSAFQRTGLDIGEHTLVMTAMQGSQASILLFDYAVYT